MRVTQSMALRDFLRDVEGARAAMLQAQNKVSTGRSILRPSDDPRANSDVLRLQADKHEVGQYERNLGFSRSQLSYTETAVEGLQNLIDRVRTLALSAIGTQSQTDAFVTEVQGLRDQILGAANTSFQGRFIFGGSDTETQPFQQDPSGFVTYAGNSDVAKVQVGRTTALQVQVPGDQLFGAGNDVFQAVTDLIGAMQSGIKSDIDAALKPITAVWDGLSVTRSRVGTLINAADSMSTEITALSLARESRRLDLEQASLAETLTEFQSYENALQSTLAMGARISQLTLLDYLR